MTRTARVAFQNAYAGPIDLPPLLAQGERVEDAAPAWRAAFSDHLYGPVPPSPLTFECRCEPMAGCKRLVLNMTLPGGRFAGDAALWVPEGDGPFPLICGLDFIGPAGILSDTAFPLDAEAIVCPRPELGVHDGRLHDVLRGSSAPSWPVSLLTTAGYAVLVSCYGSWVPDDPSAWQAHGLKPLIEGPSGAISLWAWALSRLIDAAETMPDIDTHQVAVAGHSRLGKAALWAAANDPRITATFANNSGAGGAALAAHSVGETLSQLHDGYPHWLREDANPNACAMDQNALIALAHPGAVYLAQAQDDLWADPVGSYMALASAGQSWDNAFATDWPDAPQMWSRGQQIINGPLGFHLRPGGHALLPYDWHQFLGFLRALS